MIYTILWVIVILVLLGAVGGSPSLGYWNHGYGWGPSGGLGLVAFIILIVILFKLL